GPVRREGERELAERIAAQVLAERRAAPGLTAVDRNADVANALAAVEGDSAHDRVAADADALAVLQRRDERAHGEFSDRPRRRRRGARRDADAVVVGDAVGRLHTEAVELAV